MKDSCHALVEDLNRFTPYQPYPSDIGMDDSGKHYKILRASLDIEKVSVKGLRNSFVTKAQQILDAKE